MTKKEAKQRLENAQQAGQNGCLLFFMFGSFYGIIFYLIWLVLFEIF